MPLLLGDDQNQDLGAAGQVAGLPADEAKEVGDGDPLAHAGGAHGDGSAAGDVEERIVVVGGRVLPHVVRNVGGECMDRGKGQAQAQDRRLAGRGLRPHPCRPDEGRSRGVPCVVRQDPGGGHRPAKEEDRIHKAHLAEGGREEA